MGNSLRFPKCPEPSQCPECSARANAGAAPCPECPPPAVARCPPVTRAEFEAAVAKLEPDDGKLARGIALAVYMRAVAYVYREIVQDLADPGMKALTRSAIEKAQREFVRSVDADLKFAPEGAHLEGTGVRHVTNTGDSDITRQPSEEWRLFGGAVEVVPVHLGSSIEPAKAVEIMDTYAAKEAGKAVLFIGDFNAEASKVEAALGGRATVIKSEKPTTSKVRGVADNMQLSKAFEVASKNIDFAVLYTNGVDGIEATIKLVEGSLMSEKIASDHYPVLVTLTKDGESKTVFSWNAFGKTLQKREDDEPVFTEFLPPDAWKKSAAYHFYKGVSNTKIDGIVARLQAVRLGDATTSDGEDVTLYSFVIGELRRHNKKRGEDVHYPGGLGKNVGSKVSRAIAEMFGVEPSTKFVTTAEMLSRPEVVFPGLQTKLNHDQLVALLRTPFKLIMHTPVFKVGLNDPNAPIRYSLAKKPDDEQKWYKEVMGASHTGPIDLSHYFNMICDLWRSTDPIAQ